MFFRSLRPWVLAAAAVSAFAALPLAAQTVPQALAAGPAFPAQKPPPVQKARIVENYGKLPLSFEANTGQIDNSAKFLSRGSGYELYLTGNEAALVLCKTVFGAARPGLQRNLPPIQKSMPCDVVRMKLAIASGKAKPVGEEQLPGTANYFIGNDPVKWRTGVPTYAKVRYADIYPGIDLVYYGNQQQLEYDFVVAPGVDPKPIRLQLAGVKELHLAADGDLVVTAANRAVVFRKPLLYQIVDGQRHEIAGDFALVAKHTVGFRLGSYDRTKALVIDPVLVYSTYLGGSGGDAGNAIAVDTAGNVYVAGGTSSTNFPVTPGAFQTTNHAAANGSTAFVTKLNPTGTALVYSTYLGGSGGDSASGLAVDVSGNAYVIGSTSSTDFPVTQGAFQTTNKAATDGDSTAFVVKLNPTGTALLYSTYLGGSGLSVNSPYGGETGNAIAVDAAGDAYVAGKAFSADFPVTPGAYQTANNGAANEDPNVFVTKLNPAGTALLYSTYLGGSGAPGEGIYKSVFSGDTGNAIAVDAAGDVYVTGQTFSADFPVTQGAFQTTNKAVGNLGTNAFIAELNPAGAELIYSTYLGGSAGDTGNAIAVNTAGNVYVAGNASSPDFPVTPGAFQTTNHGVANGNDLFNAFVTELNPAGTALVYSTYLGGSGGVINIMPTLATLAGDQANGLAIDSSGDAYVTGSTASADFPVTQGAYQTTNNDQTADSIGGYNAFVTELNPAGSALVYSTYLGGDGLNPNDLVGVIVYGKGDQANALALDNSGNVYLTGSACSYDFPVTSGAYQTTIPSRGSAFVTKLNIGATSTTTTPTVTVTPASTSITSGQMLPVTISVAGTSGATVPTGSVTVASGTYSSAATTLSEGSATIDIPGGSLLGEPFPYQDSPPDVLAAKYVPDAASSSTYNVASGIASVQVLAATVWVTPTLPSINSMQAKSQPIALIIVVTSGPGYPTPTGTVTLTEGSYTSAAATLTGGTATITVPAGTLTPGFNTNLIANYSGDNNYAAVSAPSMVYVNAGTFLVSVAPSAASITPAQALPVTITVSAGSGNPTPTGTVMLFGNNYSSTAGYSSASTVLTGGSATITIPAGSLPTGTDSLQADYAASGTMEATGYASVTVTSGTPGFNLSNTGNITVSHGATGDSSITVAPSNGFTGQVNLTCAVSTTISNPVAPPTCSIPSTVTISGNNAATTTLTVTTTAASSVALGVPLKGFFVGGAGIALAMVLSLSIPVRRHRWSPVIGLFVVVFLIFGLACGCGAGNGGGNPGGGGTTPGAYTATVTGADTATGKITASTTVTVTVN